MDEVNAKRALHKAGDKFTYVTADTASAEQKASATALHTVLKDATTCKAGKGADVALPDPADKKCVDIMFPIKPTDTTHSAIAKAAVEWSYKQTANYDFANGVAKG